MLFRSGDDLKIFAEDNGILQDIYPKTSGRQPHALNIEHFVDVLMGKVEPDFTPTQGVNMIKILEAIYKSAETGMEVRL